MVTHNILSTAPTGPPASVMTTSTPNSITVQWGPVDCADRNGDITGYSVRYGVGSGSTQTMPISGGDMTEYIISDLTPSTVYTVSVAAVNTAGTGVYSDEKVQRTAGEHFPHCLFILNSVVVNEYISPPPYIQYIIFCFYDLFWDGDTYDHSLQLHYAVSCCTCFC